MSFKEELNDKLRASLNDSNSSLASLDSSAKSYDSIQEGYCSNNFNIFNKKNNSCSSLLSDEDQNNETFIKADEKNNNIKKINNFLPVKKKRERFKNQSRSPQIKDVLKYLTLIDSSPSLSNDVYQDYFIDPYESKN